MYFQQDYILRQIEMMAHFIARAVFHKDNTDYDIVDEEHLSEPDRLAIEIDRLLEQKKICEAENLLFEQKDPADIRFLEVAVDFYQTINGYSDEELENHDFSREEVRDGFQEIIGDYGFSELGLE